MKKILSVLAIGAAVMTASAQSVEGNKFFDNWSIGLVGGGITKLPIMHSGAVCVVLTVLN